MRLSSKLGDLLGNLETALLTTLIKLLGLHFVLMEERMLLWLSFSEK